MTGSRSESFSYLARSECVRLKPVVLSTVFFRAFHENYGCSFCYIFQSGKPNRLRSEYAVHTGFDDPPGEKILHEHIRMQIRPRYAAIAKICFNQLMPGENDLV